MTQRAALLLGSVFVTSSWMGCSPKKEETARIRVQAVALLERGSDDHSAHMMGRASVFVSDHEGSPAAYWTRDEGAEPKRVSPPGYRVADPRLAPEGDRLAFVASTEHDPMRHLYIVFLAGGEPIPVSPKDAEAAHPRWLPDGTGLVYSRRAQGSDDFDIATVQIGGEARVLFGGPGDQLFPALRPDGRRLVFRDTGIGLHLGELDGESKLVAGPGFRHPEWSPDGRFLAAEKDGRIQLFSAHRRDVLLLEGDIPDGSRPTWTDSNSLRVDREVVALPSTVWLDADRIQRIEIPDGEGVTAPSPSSQSTLGLGCRQGDIVLIDMREGSKVFQYVTRDSFPDFDPGWAPDGRSFVYTSVRGGNTDLYLQGYPDGSERRLTDHEAIDHMGRFTSSGNKIVFISERSGDARIHLLEVDTGAIEIISSPLGGNPTHPSLSPNDRWVYYSTDRNDRRQIEAYNLVTDEQRPLTEGDPGRDVEPACSPDGIYVAFRRWEGGDSDIYIVPAAGGDARPVFEDPRRRAGHPDWVRGGIQLLFENGGGADLWDLHIAGLE